MIQTILDKIGIWRTITWEGRHFVALAAGAAIIFMIISLTIGMQQSVWFDEAYSIIVAKQQSAQVVQLAALDTHPPLYYLLLKGWATLFGWSELALRSLSVLAGGLSIFVAAMLARRMFGARIAVYALPFVVLAPFLLRYGFEIRMYALASLIGVLATYILVRAREASEQKDRRMLYVLYAVLVALGMYTLYYTALLWIAHVVWLVWLCVKERQSVWRQPWLLAYVGSIILFLPWLPAFISQVGNGALAAISQAMTVENLVGLVSFEFLYQPVWKLSPLLSLAIVGVIAALCSIFAVAYRKVSTKKRPYLTLLAMYFAVPVAVLTLVSLFRPMYVERYLSHVAIGGMLFVGVAAAIAWVKGSASVRRMILGLMVVLVGGVMQLASTGNYNFQRLQKPAIDELASQMNACKDGATVLAADPYVAIELDYYLPDCSIYFYSQYDELKGGYAPMSRNPLRISEPKRELASAGQILYVYYDQPQLTMPDGLRQTGVSAQGPMTLATFSAE